MSYQTFKELGIKGSSKSEKKLEVLKFNPTGKAILDVGCNAGFFSMEFAKQGAKSVLGIDSEVSTGPVIKQATDIATSLGIQNVGFSKKDFFEIEELFKFDTIVCLSVFHYFREKQGEFFEKAHRLLKDGGKIILECGIANNDEAIYKYARDENEVPCRYPSEETIQLLADGFTMKKIGKSVSQPGDKISRYVYHLKKSNEANPNYR